MEVGKNKAALPSLRFPGGARFEAGVWSYFSGRLVVGGRKTEEEQRNTAPEQTQPEGTSPGLPRTDTGLAGLPALLSPALPQAPATKQ